MDCVCRKLTPTEETKISAFKLIRLASDCGKPVCHPETNAEVSNKNQLVYYYVFMK
ncbi:hypothetical protein BAE44_0003036 [Dichanthelium oligosanthes]|uniref:Bifunctional inhibitor/plant lipid transfer protein/seed storage helical domain-containing protein n=1 Tax=Dichanthelium oligosanthes TaxID=888268 RepID=A0A1E5WEX5_9POAL|nr:hypothetical protein BAE44_0003036 [Dichanthelium oligosanthes]